MDYVFSLPDCVVEHAELEMSTAVKHWQHIAFSSLYHCQVEWIDKPDLEGWLEKTLGE